jgi:hypothetical protein
MFPLPVGRRSMWKCHSGKEVSSYCWGPMGWGQGLGEQWACTPPSRHMHWGNRTRTVVLV